jgi:hypothetical protein
MDGKCQHEAWNSFLAMNSSISVYETATWKEVAHYTKEIMIFKSKYFSSESFVNIKLQTCL